MIFAGHCVLNNCKSEVRWPEREKSKLICSENLEGKEVLRVIQKDKTI